MKFYLLAICLVFSIVSFSQLENQTLGVPSERGGETVYYSLIFDSPEDLRILSFNLPIWNIAVAKINTSIYDLNFATLYHTPKYQAYVRYKYGLGDQIAPDSYEGSAGHPQMFSVNKVPKSQEFNLMGTYFISSKKLATEERMKLKTTGKVTTFTTIPNTTLKSVGLNLGYTQGFTWYNMNNASITGESGGTSREYKLASMTTVQTYKFIKAGLSFTRATYVKAKFDNYGVRESGTLITTWLNLICAVQNDFDDVFVPVDEFGNGGAEQTMIMRASINEANKKLPVGIEFGQRFSSNKGFISLEYGVKYLPGFLGNINFMIEGGFNLSLNVLKRKS